jgi:ribosomal protein S12 methylthiotransferase accessory factor
MMAFMSNAQSILRTAARLTGLQALRPPSAPGATIVMGLLAGEAEPMTFAGCSLDAEQAFQACVGEAAEFLAQSDHRAGIASSEIPADAVTTLEALEGTPTGGWLTGMAFPSGRQVSLPAASCCYLPASAHLDISTGCAAGRSIEHAMQHALSELIERDAARRWWRGSHTARAMDISHPALASAMAWLGAARCGDTGRDVTLLDISGDAVIPVVAAVSFLQHGGGFVVGTAAHPQLGKAAEGALREMVQMEFGLFLAMMKRERAGRENLPQPDLRHLLREEIIHPACPLLKPEGGSAWQDDKRQTAADCSSIAGRLTERGHEVFATRLNDDPFLPVIRMLVKGFPIALRAPPLTHTDNHWKYLQKVGLY